MLRFWLHTLRIFLALSLITYGASKLFGLQFMGGEKSWDKPINQLSGMALLWAFFAWSRSLQIAVGIAQIGASVLLLRHKTALLGAVLYLPIISVVVLFDLCFHVVPDATGMALLLFAGDALVLWCYRGRLYNALRCFTSDAPPLVLPAEPAPPLTQTGRATGAGIGFVLLALLLPDLVMFLLAHHR